jgi:hypothetical protein
MDDRNHYLIGPRVPRNWRQDWRRELERDRKADQTARDAAVFALGMLVGTFLTWCMYFAVI